jgi:transcriptional regulator with XRE-family HTH domain
MGVDGDHDVDWLGVLGPEVIRDCREQADFSAKEFAEQCGVTNTSVRAWERGKTSPGLHNCRTLRRVFEDAGVVPPSAAVIADRSGEARGDVQRVLDVIEYVLGRNHGDTTAVDVSDFPDDLGGGPGENRTTRNVLEALCEVDSASVGGLSVESDHSSGGKKWVVSE